MGTKQIIQRLVEADRYVYLAKPGADSWEPSVLSLANKALKVLRVSGDDITVLDPEDEKARETITFKAGEVSDTRPPSGSARAYYAQDLANRKDLDPDEGAEEHDTNAYSEIVKHMGDWKAFSNGPAKMRAMSVIARNPVIRMNSLRTLYSDLIHANKLPKKYGFDKFMKTPLTVWRGSNLTKDNPISATWAPNMTGIFGSSYKANITPDQIAYYIGGTECEVLVNPEIFSGQHKR